MAAVEWGVSLDPLIPVENGEDWMCFFEGERSASQNDQIPQVRVLANYL
jgi:hypothetical protein